MRDHDGAAGSDGATGAPPEGATIPALLARAVAAGPGRAWLRTPDGAWTLAQAAAEVDRYAVGLAERGVVAGDRVALLLGNRAELIFGWLAANRLGAIAVPLDPAAKPAELGGLLSHCRPRLAVTGDASTAALLEVARGASRAAGETTPVEAAALAACGAGSPAAPVSPDDVAVLVFTSGTTGRPKAVMQTHRTYALAAEAFPFWLGLGPSDRLLCVLPLFHINAQAYSTLGSLACGATLALEPRFSASRFWDDARRTGATAVNAVGAMIHLLLAREPRPDDRAQPIRRCYAALALPEAQHRAFEERFGLEMAVGYGLSESTFGCVWPRDRPPRYGTMGVLRQHPTLGVINHGRIVCPDGTDAADGEPGELWLSNPATMRGYWEDPVATAAVLRDGWLRTGDLVRRDADGFHTFVARLKEVIRRRGHNVGAGEVEGVLCQHPSVAEAAVVGVPSPLGEEDLVAFVLPRAGARCEPAALVAWARERLSDYKVPSRIEVRETFPRTATERVAKHLLR